MGGPCSKYEVRVCPVNNNPAGCVTRDCGPPVQATGVTVCPNWTGLTGGTSYTVTATCVKSDGSKGPTSAPETFATPAAGGPAVSADPVDAVTGVAHCTKSATGGPWVKFELTVCKKGTSTCLQNLPLCTAGSGSVTDCPIPGCEPLTEYDVSIVALKADNSKSPVSNIDSFKTPAAPAPRVIVNDADTTTTSTTAKVVPPALGGPWDNYKLTVCQTSTANCKTFNCAPAKIAACPLSGLNPDTFYSVTVVAQKTGAPDSLVSKPDTFRTLSDAAPTVVADPLNAVTGLAKCTRPKSGGPWVNMQLTVCKKGTNTCLQNLPLCPITGAVTNCQINGCTPLTDYEVVIVALKADGTKSPISNKDYFRTPAAPAPGISVNDGATSTTSTTAKVTPPNLGGPFTNYKLTVCPTGSSSCKTFNCAPANIAACALNGLSPDTSYTVTVVAQKTVSFDSLVGGPDSFKTLANPTPPNPHAEAKGPTEAEIDVTAPTVGGPCNKYELRVCPVNNNPAGCVTRDCGPPVQATGVTVCPNWTGLTGGTSYTVTATCVKSDGSKGPTSAPETFATPAAGGPAVSADPVNAVTGVAHCTKPATGGPWVKFELTVCKKGTSTCLQGLPLCSAGSGSVTDCTINGCEPKTTYEVTIYALKSDNSKSPISNKDDFTTPAAPAPGISVNDADTTDTSTTAAVTPPSLGGPWTNYKLTVCEVGGACKDVNCAPADIASCDITGLKPSTSYTVTVVAQKTGSADSLVGGPDTFKTDDPAPLVGSLTACKTDGDCEKTTGELCDPTQKKCYCPGTRAWCPGTVGEPFCCGVGQTCGNVLIKGETETGCVCSADQFTDRLATSGASNGCKATSSVSNPYTCSQCDADRAGCENGYTCGQKCEKLT